MLTVFKNLKNYFSAYDPLELVYFESTLRHLSDCVHKVFHFNQVGQE